MSIPGNQRNMRADAARSCSQSEEMRVWTARMDSEVDGIQLEGPAARSIRATTRARNEAVALPATELRGLSQLFLRSAGQPFRVSRSSMLQSMGAVA